MFMPKKDNARVEFNRGFYLAPCFESINSKTTLLIDIIDSNNVPLCILWLYRLECSLGAYKEPSANSIQKREAAGINEEVSNKLDLRFTFFLPTPVS